MNMNISETDIPLHLYECECLCIQLLRRVAAAASLKCESAQPLGTCGSRFTLESDLLYTHCKNTYVRRSNLSIISNCWNEN